MDREKVIRAVESCFDYWLVQHRCLHPLELENVQELKADSLALLKEHGWIPITERLPKDDTDILVYCTDGEESRIVAVNYANGVWFDCVFNTVMVVENITHWMPLPKPPKEGR